MRQFVVPIREQVSEKNQVIFDNMQKMFGTVPNLYAMYAYNETALEDYLALQNRKSTLSATEREVINLVVSQVNDCKYCLAAHTVVGKMCGFTDAEIIEIRKCNISFDDKLNALACLVQEITDKRGKASEKTCSAFFEAGYNDAALIDVLITIGDKTISNYLHGITQIPIDFPLVPEIN